MKMMISSLAQDAMVPILSQEQVLTGKWRGSGEGRTERPAEL